MSEFNGLFTNLGNLHRLSHVQSRSISAENPRGEKGKGGLATQGTGAGCARDLGRGWKISPSVNIAPGETYTLAEIDGPGAIQSMWMAGRYHHRFNILRIYWDDQAHPSVECPIGDFFCNGWGQWRQLTSLAVCLNPGQGAFNCYWPMPFRKRCRMTLTNLHTEPTTWYYQINYGLGPVSDDAAYFHARWNRTNPLPYKDVYTIVDGIKGQGHYAGTYLAWGVNNNGWWGEGEIKFYMDGDLRPGQEIPERGGDAGATIVGTGTEDYFNGCYNWDVPGEGYREYCTPYAGMFQVIKPNGLYAANTRFGMYRWHIPDPIRFEKDLKVTIQALGWRSGGRYLANQDDIASVAYWYQTLPSVTFPALPDKDYLEVI